ncbi:MAG: DMT family transporter [Pseudomonadota bacterium]
MIAAAPKTLLFTVLALSAFAGNSILCRLALSDYAIDAASFTTVRLICGALTLSILIFVGTNKRDRARRNRSWKNGLLLFIYAAAFSFAYQYLDTGTGALLLFAAVQITMIGASLARGKHLSAKEYLGTAVAFAGLAYLMAPGVTQPSILGLVLMSMAGLAWGLYSLAGRGSTNPIADTGDNFTAAVPLAAALSLFFLSDVQLSTVGLILAGLSGGLTSGIGYVFWYTALPALSEIEAGVLQLTVPVIAALGGVLFASESVSLRLVVSSVLVLGGILIVILGRRPPRGSKS